MISNVTGLLEKYIKGKDLDRYKILEEIYCSNAIVSFELKAENINFPSEIHGNFEIAKVLSADFNKKYDLVKTYYLSSHFPEADNLSISGQNWLVIMREIANCNIRIGTGYYNWAFESQNQSEIKIKHHKIFIHSMAQFPDKAIDLLHELQRKFEYPWVERENAIRVLEQYSELNHITNYLTPHKGVFFSMPLDGTKKSTLRGVLN
ncbi:MAG: hypothetical protein GY799_16280 [Desulfobulbaceae bacterium]|nr:hypothetical protein [Desulfobulbaceae bacterium]